MDLLHVWESLEDKRCQKSAQQLYYASVPGVSPVRGSGWLVMTVLVDLLACAATRFCSGIFCGYWFDPLKCWSLCLSGMYQFGGLFVVYDAPPPPTWLGGYPENCVWLQVPTSRLGCGCLVLWQESALCRCGPPMVPMASSVMMAGTLMLRKLSVLSCVTSEYAVCTTNLP